MSNTERQFFALLRSGLWGRDTDHALFSEVVNWNGILRIAEMQTVTGILFDGVSNLPAGLQPPAEVIRRIYQKVVRIERSHHLLNKRLEEIIPRFYSEGIRPVLLKGQGVAQNYPNPVRRQCGDIDLYVGKKDCERAMQVLLSLGAEAENKVKRRSPKHENFDLGGVSIELHSIIEKLYNPVYDKRFQPWTERQFDGDGFRTWNMDGTEILLPPINFDALYIFNHIYHHLISGGIGLRQLCDWAVYLHTFISRVDERELLANLQSFGIFRAWQVFGCIVIDYLGLPKSEFPFYTAKHAKSSERIMRKILQGGNFGTYGQELKKRPSDYLAGKLHSLYVKQKWLLSILPVFPKEVMVFYLYYWYTGINNIRKGW